MSENFEPVKISLHGAVLNGDLKKAENSGCIVVFVHGSGSGRHSPRNRYVASNMIDKGLSVLLMDLLTEEEERVDNVTREYRFDIPMLAQRVKEVIDWVKEIKGISDMSLGLYGSSTGAAAALIAAASKPEQVKALVSRGGRVDLASNVLHRVKSATLFIVGSRDTSVLYANKEALEKLDKVKKLEVVSGAGHLFSEPSALEEVTRLSIEWFKKHC